MTTPKKALDLDPIELVEEAEGGGKRRVRKAKGLMVGGRKVPYPPTPTDVPEDLTEYADSFVRQQNRLLAGLFLFLIFYLGAILFCALIAAWSIWSFSDAPVLKVILLIVTGLGMLLLLKGFFKQPAIDRNTALEATEDDHPLLLAFINNLCEELDSPEPNKVILVPDVNAMCSYHVGLFNLFVEPKRDLIIGLGLVNAVNLSEFKGILAHELGHFTNVGKIDNYSNIVRKVIENLIGGEDFLDRMVNWLKQQESLQWLGYMIGGPLWLWQSFLGWVYHMIAIQYLAVSREQEFHADLVAVSAAGSDAATHGLLRARFGMHCFIQALNDMATAIQHKLYSNDMYLHQDRAAAIVRQEKKDPVFGLPPELPHPMAGKSIQVFDAEQDELEDEDQTPPMWRSHPPDAEREQNAKRRFVAAVMDHRSPWLLFDDSAELKERVTYKFYRSVFNIPKNAELTDAVKVQQFIDNEHSETTYAPKYKGVYDERPLEPGELEELDRIIKETPWNADRMEKVHARLYDDCAKYAETRADLYKEMQTLQSNIVGRPSSKMKRKIQEIEKQQEENWEWFKSFDRRVYLLHVQMAGLVSKEMRQELVERYRFQREVQRLYTESRNAYDNADAYLSAFAASARGEIELPEDFIGEVLQVLRTSWKSLKNIIRDAREINLPAMKNFEEGDNLAEFILEGKMVPEPPLSYAKGVWIDKLMKQLDGVKNKCFRLHFKSVGGILALQEKIAAKWQALREPVAAEVVEAEPVAAEIVAAEVVPAEVVPAEIVADEVIPAEVIPAEPLPSVPAAPRVAATPSEQSAVMAAFVNQGPQSAQTHHPELRSPPATVQPPVAEARPIKPVVEVAGPTVAEEDIFSLGSDEAVPPPVSPVAAPAPAPPPVQAQSELPFSLDADEYQAPAPPPLPPTAPAATKPAAPVVARTTTFKPAKGKRPPIKITLVKPGEASPMK